VPSYPRFDLVLERGDGSYVWDVDGSVISILLRNCGLLVRHAHPEMTNALAEQSRKLIHVRIYIIMSSRAAWKRIVI